MVALIIIIIILSILIGVFITLVVGNNVNLTGDTKVKESINDDNIVEEMKTYLRKNLGCEKINVQDIK